MSFKIVGARELWYTDSPGVNLLQLNRDIDGFPLIKKTGVQGPRFVENVHSAEFATREPVS